MNADARKRLKLLLLLHRARRPLSHLPRAPRRTMHLPRKRSLSMTLKSLL